MKDSRFTKFANDTAIHLDDKIYVTCGHTSLDYWGLTKRYINTIHVLTSRPLLDGVIFLARTHYHYSEQINEIDYVLPLKINPKILMPTKERAIIENIKNDLKFIDEGTFVESLYCYKEIPQFFNYQLLLEVANHFGVPKDKVDYWLEECEEVGSWG